MEFREEQYAPGWVWALVGGTALLSGVAVGRAALAAGQKATGALWPSAAVVAVMAALSRMTTTVDENGVKVVFGLLPVYTRTISLSEIVEVHAESYSPLREFGGWGIRGLGNNRALNMQGNQGVRLTLNDGSRLLIGSGRPDELETAIRSYRLG